MKARPRRAENAIAHRLSHFSSQFLMRKIERIPAPGRRGPDLTINELGLVVDVKSRLQVPKSAMTHVEGDFICMGDLAGMRLIDFCSDVGIKNIVLRKPSKMVMNWWDHMDEWKNEHKPDDITALVLHRPGMLYDHSVLYLKDWSKLNDRTERISNL